MINQVVPFQPGTVIQTTNNQSVRYSAQGTQSNGQSIGGTTTGVVRYPHLIEKLNEIAEDQKVAGIAADVLLLGPGRMSEDRPNNHRISSPDTHIILRAFPKETNVTVVDVQDFSNLPSSRFEKFELKKFSIHLFTGFRE